MSKSPMHRMTWTFHHIFRTRVLNAAGDQCDRVVLTWNIKWGNHYNVRLDVRNWISICSLSTVLRASHNKQMLQLVKWTIGWWYSVSTKQRCEDVLYQQFHKPLVSRQRISPRRLHLCDTEPHPHPGLHQVAPFSSRGELGLGTLADHINSLDTSYFIWNIQGGPKKGGFEGKWL